MDLPGGLKTPRGFHQPESKRNIWHSEGNQEGFVHDFVEAWRKHQLPALQDGQGEIVVLGFAVDERLDGP